jgi:hypothetical protein
MLTTLPAAAQSSIDYLQVYFNSLKQNENPDRFVAEKIEQMDVSTLCENISPYLNDPLSMIRLKAYILLHQRGLQNIKPKDKQRIIANLLRGWFDADTGINGFVASALSVYAKSDFTKSAKDNIVLLINKSPGYYHQLIKIAGFLEIQELIPVLQQKLSNTIKMTDRVRWATYLALSRMGDSSATQVVLNKVKSLSISDEVVYTLFPDLVYTRQREVIDYLIEQLNSDEANCNSSNPEKSKRISCGYRIMEYLTVAVKNYPLTTDISGELMVNNYEKALQDVRAWFRHANGRYEIKNEHL